MLMIPKSFLRRLGRSTTTAVRNAHQTSTPVREKPRLRLDKEAKAIGPVGWLLFLVPTATFGLGTWQVQRKKWKEALISEMQSRSNTQPQQLPTSSEALNKLEYYPVHVRGEFIHDKEIYMGPRTLLVNGDASTDSTLMSSKQNKAQGFLVITPFKLANREETILINRGWVPGGKKNPETRPNGQVKGVVDVIGLVRLHEQRPNFMPVNKNNVWYYRDLEQMSAATGSSEIFLDATGEFQPKGGPIGGQTRITLRNEHMSYIITWYSLCAITSMMWYKQFLHLK